MNENQSVTPVITLKDRTKYNKQKIKKIYETKYKQLAI